jgi:drug/metabolite transporter (DMT)-like permease
MLRAQKPLLVLMGSRIDTGPVKITRTPTPSGVATDWRVLAAASFTVVAWASAFVAIRFVGQEYSPGGLALGRLLIASACLTAIMALRRGWVPMSPRAWGLTVLIGVLWFGVYNVALNAGEQLVDAGTAAMLIQLAPILIGVLAGVLLGEGFPRMLVIGGLVAFGGTVLIGVATSTGHADLNGVLLVLLAAVVYAAAVVAQKVVLREIPGLQVTWLACVIGTVACLPFAPALLADLQTSSTGTTVGLVYLGVVPTAAAFLTWAYALARTDAGRLGATTYAVPPIAILLGWIFLGEVPAPLAVVGGVISLVGVAIARRPGRRPSAGPATRAAEHTDGPPARAVS